MLQVLQTDGEALISEMKVYQVYCTLAKEKYMESCRELQLCNRMLYSPLDKVKGKSIKNNYGNYNLLQIPSIKRGKFVIKDRKAKD